jgi:hypothetical protein
MTGGHVHRGVAGVNGPVIFGFPNPLTSPIGPLTWAIPAADVTNLQNGGLYVNLHTQTFLGGEIRGQLLRARLAPSATNAAQTALANALDVSAGFSSDLDAVLVQTNVASASIQTQTLDQLGATSVYAQGRQGVDTMASMTGRLLARADDARGANSKPQSGFMPFASISYDFGTRSATANGPGSKSTRPVFLAGGAFASEAGAFGLAIGYADGKDKLKNNLGQSKVETTSI